MIRNVFPVIVFGAVQVGATYNCIVAPFATVLTVIPY
jgi:hypothetical protein